MDTLFLRSDTWDLALDVNGNIAISKEIYATAQDIASSCRVFRNDLYFSQNEGIPYLEEILGKTRYSLSLYRDQLEQRALLVPNVKTAKVVISTSNGRILTGQIQFTTEAEAQGILEL